MTRQADRTETGGQQHVIHGLQCKIIINNDLLWILINTSVVLLFRHQEIKPKKTNLEVVNPEELTHDIRLDQVITVT